MTTRVQGYATLLRIMALNPLFKLIVSESLDRCAAELEAMDSVCDAVRAYIKTDAAILYAADDTPPAVRRLFDSIAELDGRQE